MYRYFLFFLVLCLFVLNWPDASSVIKIHPTPNGLPKNVSFKVIALREGLAPCEIGVDVIKT